MDVAPTPSSLGTEQTSTRPAVEGPQANAGDYGAASSMQPSRLAWDMAMLTFRAWFRGDAQHSQDWRTQAKIDFDFVAGDQWTEKDQALLKDQNRTPITFNRSLTIIKAICGMEINGRHEISFLPRKLEDSPVDETLTGACKWMSDECDGEDEESEAFAKAVICGMGWLEHRMDYEEEAEGKYLEEWIDPLEMYWDRSAKKKNLTDARRIWRVRVMPLGDAQQLFPGKSAAQLDAKWALGLEPATPQKTLEERRRRDENSSGPLADQEEVTLVQVQWWEREDCWIVADQQNQSLLKLDDATYQKLKQRHEEVQHIMTLANPGYRPQPLVATRGKRKVFKQAFLGQEILEMGASPVPDRFSFTCVTGEFHHNRRTWFGVIRTLRDPQMWGNKWLSQVLHILNTTAKGGIVVEADVFEDQREAEQKWARPDGIVTVKKLYNANNQPKIMPKPGAADGAAMAAYVELLTMATNATRDVTGINLELLGQKDLNQPGVLEAMRKQAGMTVLATMFDALRRMRKLVGRIRLYYIQNFLSDGRMIRITGKQGAQSVRLLRDKTIGEYDVIVDDTPTSPNQKEATWGIISQMLPAFKDQLMARPDVFIKLLGYSPLPTALVADIENTINNPPQQQVQQQQTQQQLQVAAALAKISKDQGQAELFNKQAQSTEATAMYDIAMAKNLLLKHQGDMAAAMNEVHKNALEEAKMRIDAAHTTAKIGTERAKANTERARADNLDAQTEGQQAATLGTHASTAGQHVSNLIDMLTPIPHRPPPEPMPAQPAGAMQ